MESVTIPDNFQELNNDIQQCNRCRIALQTDLKLIGKGSLAPKVLFVGLNPGKVEVKKKNVFVGPAGKVLDKWINFLELEKDEWAAINLIKCHTPNQKDLDGTEVDACYPFYERQLALLNPDYIVVLGDIVFKKITDSNLSITEAEGKFIDNVFVMRHPSYFLRRGGMGWMESLQKLKDVLVPQITQDYVPLHCHSEYSVGDGAGRLEDLVAEAKKQGFGSMALTDHGTIAGWFQFNQECLQNNIKPIFGVEFYVTPSYEVKTRKRYHLVALAKNEQGIKNIFKLNTIANNEGFYFKPRITLGDLVKYKDGLIITSACTIGVISQLILDGEMDKAYKAAESLKKEFGDDFYIEFQPHYAFPSQLVSHASLTKICEDLDIKATITCDVHYRNKGMKQLHNAVKAITFNKKYGEANFSGDTHCLLSTEDLKKAALETNMSSDLIDKAINSTVEIAEKCNAKFPEYNNVIPKFKIPTQEKK
jgi:uracil-DNA glycosylase family 4